ncbi:hypothetical protein TNCT_387511 [Trichonephila clavata]|uniref:Uncharacterized protein n=1 Tax=Trichonephila clavata TaxID=2740835 RepID=A0A8X6J365_TRICU|nr:hypothetical protein TNCT_387511 [Trichonephila clavata]
MEPGKHLNSPQFITPYFRAANRELSHLLFTTNSHALSPACNSMTNISFSRTAVSRQNLKSASLQTLTSPLCLVLPTNQIAPFQQTTVTYSLSHPGTSTVKGTKTLDRR